MLSPFKMVGNMEGYPLTIMIWPNGKHCVMIRLLEEQSDLGLHVCSGIPVQTSRVQHAPDYHHKQFFIGSWLIFG